MDDNNSLVYHVKNKCAVIEDLQASKNTEEAVIDYFMLFSFISVGDPDTDCNGGATVEQNVTCDFDNNKCGYTSTALVGNATWTSQYSPYSGVVDQESYNGKQDIL